MKTAKKTTFTSTGEFRIPRKGEWYFFENAIHQAYCDFERASFDIYVREEIEEKCEPKEYETYYYIDFRLQVNEAVNGGSGTDKKLFQINNYFESNEEAELAVQEIKKVLDKNKS